MQRSAASSTSSRTDTLAVREALVQESAKRDAALQARERSGPSASVDAETRWELSYVKKIDGTGRAAVVDWGYGEVVGGDGSPGAVSESESEPEPEQQGVKSGRMVFGKFRSKAEVGCVFAPPSRYTANEPPHSPSRRQRRTRTPTRTRMPQTRPRSRTSPSVGLRPSPIPARLRQRWCATGARRRATPRHGVRRQSATPATGGDTCQWNVRNGRPRSGSRWASI